MNIFETYEHLIRFELERMVSAGDLPPADFARVSVEPSRDDTFGDLTTNAALVASGGVASLELAQELAKHFVCLHDVVKAEAADNGLVNLKLKPVVWHRAISGILHGTAGKDPCKGIIYDSAADFSASDPAFNVQHARTMCCAVLRHAQTTMGRGYSDNDLAAVSFDRMPESETALMRKLIGWQYAARGNAAKRSGYAQDLANEFRTLCTTQTGEAAFGFVTAIDNKATLARLALVRATAVVLAEAA